MAGTLAMRSTLPKWQKVRNCQRKFLPSQWTGSSFHAAGRFSICCNLGYRQILATALQQTEAKNTCVFQMVSPQHRFGVAKTMVICQKNMIILRRVVDLREAFLHDPPVRLLTRACTGISVARQAPRQSIWLQFQKSRSPPHHGQHLPHPILRQKNVSRTPSMTAIDLSSRHGATMNLMQPYQRLEFDPRVPTCENVDRQAP